MDHLENGGWRIFIQSLCPTPESSDSFYQLQCYLSCSYCRHCNVGGSRVCRESTHGAVIATDGKQNGHGGDFDFYIISTVFSLALSLFLPLQGPQPFSQSSLLLKFKENLDSSTALLICTIFTKQYP
jgi:hypothetical protein